MKKLISFDHLKKKWMKDPLFREAYQDLKLKYEIVPKPLI